MRLEITDSGTAIKVTLSRRNCLTLLSKLDNWPESRRQIQFPGWDGPELVVEIEADEVHYRDRAAPGEMHPRSEEWIRRHSREGGPNGTV